MEMVLLKLAGIVRSDAGGLGTLSRAFADLFGFSKTLSLAFRTERYDDQFFGREKNRVVPRGQQITKADAEWLLDGADAVLSFEAFYSPVIVHTAREKGIPSCLCPMHECLSTGGNFFVAAFLCPHKLCLREVQKDFPRARAVELPVPIDVERIKFRRRERARTFLHFAHFERNNTHAVIDAWRHVKSDARLIVNCLSDMPEQPRDDRITIQRPGYVDYWQGWQEADVLLNPHRFAGLCLPHAHAAAAGMPIITTRLWPFCDTTPPCRAIGPIEPDLLDRYQPDGTGLLPPSSQALAIEPAAMRRMVICRPIIAYETVPEAIAAKVDEVYGQEIGEASADGRRWAESRSFEALRQRWLDVIVQE